MSDTVEEPRDPLSRETEMQARAEAALGRLPPRLQSVLRRLMNGWLGRITRHSIWAFVRLQMFDRSMTIAAQFFTSVFPTLILFTTWANSRDANRLADALSLPEETRSMLDDAIQGPEGSAFGVAGTVIVLASATSLSRALIRAFAVIWDIPKPKTTVASAWRWLAAVLVLVVSMVLARATTEPVRVLPPRDMLPLIVSLALDTSVALFVPWVLLAGTVRLRLLAPGALLFGLLMLVVRPATAAWLPHALEVSADRYGSIGVAFTYLACLYAAAFCFLTTAVLGQVVANDPGWLGARIRRDGHASDPSEAADPGRATTERG
jgi:membrane protein